MRPVSERLQDQVPRCKPIGTATLRCPRLIRSTSSSSSATARATARSEACTARPKGPSDQPMRPATYPEAHPLTRGAPLPHGRRRRAAVALWYLRPKVADFTAFDHTGSGRASHLPLEVPLRLRTVALGSRTGA